MASLLSIYFPFQSGTATFPRQASGDEAIRASIIQILMTRNGERIFRPGFGTKIWDYIFDSDSDSYRDGIEREVRSAISRWEPRVAISDIVIDVDESGDQVQTIISVSYVILQTGQTGSVTVAG